VGIATLAAYAIVRLRFPGRRLVLVGALAVAMFPPIAMIGPLFDLWRVLGLFDTWAGLIVPYMTLTLPLAIWTLSAFFREIPWELEQAARVDGATRLQAFRYAILPLAAPGSSPRRSWSSSSPGTTSCSPRRSPPPTDARTVPAAIAFFTGQLPVRAAHGIHRRRLDGGHHPHHAAGDPVSTSHRRRPDRRRRQGLGTAPWPRSSWST
jgi:multiple sugar transport system permease protein